MAINVDTSEAPALLRFKLNGTFPTAEEQDALRSDLIARGLLTENSASLLDVRDVDTPDAITVGKSIAAVVRAGIPKRRACLINPGKHLDIVQYFQKAVPWMSTAAFVNEREAIEWLLNPEGRAGFSR
ncbi:MAG TPA: hypothetical protein VFZ31_09885 [Vicinamibacterales bacterium]